MNFEDDIFIYRPLQPDSKAQLQTLQREYQTIDTFSPVRNLHLTILSGHSKRRIPSSSLRALVNDAPKTAEKSYSTEVSGTKLESRYRDVTRFAIKLMLDIDDSEQYFQEHDAFKDAARALDKRMLFGKFTQPHVTLGYLDAGHGLASIMEPADELIGTDLSFGPTESNITGFASRVKVKYPEPAHSSTLVDAPVRTVMPGSIPKGLLASLRAPHADTR